MQRKVYIAIATYGGVFNFNFVNCLMSAIMEASEIGMQAGVSVLSNDCLITRSRNILASKFLQSDCTDLLFVDDDVLWGPGSFTRLFSHDVDVVGAAYPRKLDDAVPPYVYRSFDERPPTFDPHNGLIEMHGVPTGFLRISRSMIEKIVALRHDEWYWDHTVPDLKVQSIFDFVFDKEKRAYYSEDYVFCQRVREVGGKTWIDPELMMSHSGNKIWTGCFGDWLREQHGLQAVASASESTLDAAKRLLVAE
jgi:hypothetical protein